MEKNKVAVIGAGLMGNGIAQACATAGYDVVNIDTFEAAIEKSKATVEKLFSRKVAKGNPWTPDIQPELRRCKGCVSCS